MAAPPPQNDDTEPDVVAFGIAAVDEALEGAGIVFPTTLEALRNDVGDREIPYDTRGRTIRFDSALAELDQEEFDTRRELLNALHPVFESKRSNGGIGDWLRAFFPF